jgi:hypothetical protein
MRPVDPAREESGMQIHREVVDLSAEVDSTRTEIQCKKYLVERESFFARKRGRSSEELQRAE